MIKNPIVQPESLMNLCRKKLNERYPAGEPPFSVDRLEYEFAYFQDIPEEYSDAFGFYYALSQAAENAGHIVQIVGRHAGSLIGHLLGKDTPNPLPAHYYCEKCGHFELKRMCCSTWIYPKRIALTVECR